MRLSLVLLTYDRPDALALVLAGLARQAVLPWEVIVTDDGSGPATRACVERYRSQIACPVQHLWQEHRGPRMARARNRGIAEARGDYVVFLDGDMVPAHRFIDDHMAMARPGCFVQGSRVLASPARTQALLESGCVDVGWLDRGLERRRHLLRMPLLREIWGRPHRRRGGVKSCNFAFWRDDLVALNGFNEGMEGWGLEDAELAQRAFHRGLYRRDLRLGGAAIHLWHAPHDLCADNPNWSVLNEVERTGAIRCARGLADHTVRPQDAEPCRGAVEPRALG